MVNQTEPMISFQLPSVLKKGKRELRKSASCNIDIEQEIVLARTIGLASCIKPLPPNPIANSGKKGH